MLNCNENSRFVCFIICVFCFLKINAQTAEDFFETGFINYTQGKYSDAVKDLTEAIKLEPKQYHLYYHRGLAYDNMRDHGAAIKDFDKAIELNSTDAQSYLGRGLSRAAIKEYKFAIEDYNTVIQLSPTDHLAFYNRGVVLLKLGKTKEACLDFEEAKKFGNEKAQETITKYCN